MTGKRVIVGISGGIAAYKVPQLVRLLVKEGAAVRCVATEHALEFVTRVTLETVSGAALYSDLFAPANEHSTQHISLKDWGDLMIVAPATANIIGKAANGIGDDALSTLLLSFRKPLFMCPAMNTQMLESPAVQRNIGQLRNDGVHIMDTVSGELACGCVGDGRMPEPDEIVQWVKGQLSAPAGTANAARQGKRILITAGPTYERIDAVRFIGNYSSGKMGIAIANAWAQQGVDVELVCGPTHLKTDHPLIHRTDVESAREMFDAATGLFPSCDAAILSAAVADYRPEQTSPIKIKKKEGEGLTLQLTQNPDILATLGTMKQPAQRLVGFALETDNEIEHAIDKMKRKNLDFIVLNSLNDKGAGFGVDTNKVTIIDRDGTVTEGALKPKTEVAKDIVQHLMSII